jgi:hypothetical protein
MSRGKLEHRNYANKKFCPGCEHSHFPHDDAGAGGLCLLHPPTPFLLGMAPKPTPVVQPGAPPETVPIIRAWFPTVGNHDTCSQFEPRAEGNA